VREVADRERIERFMTALAREATADTDVFLVGGTSAVLVGWEQRSPIISRIGRVTFRHYDFCAQALAKIERGHARDLADVDAMLARGLISGANVRAQFAQIEPDLYRFPAIDPAWFRQAVDAVFPP
jgi:hypothetical protein